MDAPTPPPVMTETLFYVVRCHHTDRGVLSVYAERDAEGHPRPHGKKRPAFSAAGLLGGRAAGFHVLEIRTGEHGELLEVSFPRGDNS